MTRLAVQDLIPNTNYAVQVRAIRDGISSEWSERFLFSTSTNTAVPVAPTITWTVVNDGFYATWTEITQDVSGGAAVIVSYELEMVASAITKYVIVPAQYGQNGQYTLDFQGNVALFGTPQPSITLRVRAVNNKGIKGNFSSPVTATNPAPGPPTSPTTTPGVDSLDISWVAPSDTDLIGYNVYTGTTSGFTPSAGNRIAFVGGTRLTYTTTTYSLQYFKIRSVDKFNQESTDALTSGTPTSPFIVDVTAPATPTALAATITNNANGIGAKAAVTWTMSSPPADLAGFNIRFRAVSTTNYQYMTGIDSADRAAQVILDLAYTNYEFQIQAYDFSDNKSAWSATYTATSPANTAPANVTGLSSVSDSNSITYTWTGVADTDIKNYEFTFSTSPTFASGNITYFTGTSTTLNVGGLTPSTTYYGRVRAVDTGGLTSAAFSATDTRATAGPAASSDGIVPGAGNTPSVMGGLSYLYTSWAPTTTNASAGAQNDTVTYEVHLSTTTGFTPSGATKVDEVSGTSMVIDHLPGTTTALSYGTTYFVKIVPKDRDGSGAASAQGSGSISKVASGDVISIGADLIVPGSGFIQNLVIGSGGSIQSSDYSAGSAGFKLNTTGGLELNTGSVKAGVITAGTWGSTTGTIQIAAGAIINMNGGYLKSNTYTGTSAASNPSGAGFYLGNDGLRIDQGTISAAAFSGGTYSTGTITLSGGSITGGGWTLNSSGLTIPDGGINAASLNLQMGQNLLPPEYSDFEAIASAYTGTNPLINVFNGTATVLSSQYYFNSQSLQWVSTNSTNQISLSSSIVSPIDYNMQLNPGSSYIVSAYVMQPTGASSITLNPRVQYKGGNVTNLLTNGDFEASPSNSGWTTNGTIGTVSTNQVVQRRTGFKGEQLTQAVTGADTYISQTVTVSPNTTYTFGAHRIVNTTLTGGALSNRSLFWIDNGTGSGASAAVLNATTPTGTWIRDSVTFTTSATASTVTVRLYAPNGTVFWDNATLVAGSSDIFDYITDLGNASVPSNGTWARYSWVFTMPSTGTTGASMLGFRTVNGTLGTLYMDGIQVEQQLGSVTTPSAWMPPSTTTIDGGIIRTGSIISSATTVVNSTTIPVWSIPLNGAASFANLQVRGNAVIGVAGGTDGGASNLSSGNYIAGTTGWQIKSDGSAEFNGATLKGGAITGTSFATDVSGQPRVVISDTNTLSGLGYPFIKFYGDGTEFGQGQVITTASSTIGLFEIDAPAARSTDSPAIFTMGTGPGLTPSTDTSYISLNADQIAINGAVWTDFSSPGIIAWQNNVAGVSISNNAQTVVNWQSHSQNYFTFASGTFTYTGPQGQKFMVVAHASWDGSVTAGRREIRILKNGAILCRGEVPGGNGTLASGNPVEVTNTVILNPNDTIAMAVYQNSGAGLTMLGDTAEEYTYFKLLTVF